ncbi:unnamed protein product [Rhizopus stolonifer]
MKRRTRESIVRNTTILMKATASDIAGPSKEVMFENEAGKNESEEVEPEEHDSDAVKLDVTINIYKKAGFALRKLNIIDLTDDTVYDLFKQSLKPGLFEKLKQPISMHGKRSPIAKKKNYWMLFVNHMLINVIYVKYYEHL